MKPRFSLLGLLGLTSFAAFACAALARPGAGWLSVIVSLAVLVAVLQLLRFVLLTGESRAVAAGWLLFACAYVALFAGPWLNFNLAPQLLTSKGLAVAQAKWQNDQRLQYPMLTSTVDTMSVDTGLINSSTLTLAPLTINPSTAPESLISNSLFLLTGQWLFALLAGWAGAALATHLYRRTAAGP